MDEFFLREIRNQPDDDQPRLVYADWLEENGDEPRAEFIRVQCELADPAIADNYDRRDDLFERQEELLQQHGSRWTEPIDAFTMKSVFNRGLIEFVSMKAEAFLKHGHILRKVGPVHSILLSFSQSMKRYGEVAESPLLSEIRGLCLSGKLRHAAAIMQSSHMGAVEKLVVSESSLDDNFATSIATCPSLRRLKMLDLTRNRIRNAGVKALAESENLSNVEHLLLRENEIRLLGSRALANSQYLSNVTYLDVRSNPIPRRGIDVLRETFGQEVVEV